jgi:prolyl oligopeptidase
MARNLSLMLLATALVGCQSQNKIEAVKEITLKPYPQTEKVDQKDTYFGRPLSLVRG